VDVPDQRLRSNRKSCATPNKAQQFAAYGRRTLVNSRAVCGVIFLWNSSEVLMKLLKPGTGNQFENRKKATQYIADNLLTAESVDLIAGNITTKEGIIYHVSAYAETTAAFVSTPGIDKSEYSIYASGLPTLMYRQLKKDNRSFVYEVNPSDIVTKPNSSSAEWSDIDKVAKRIWICTEKGVKCIDRSNKI